MTSKVGLAIGVAAVAAALGVSAAVLKAGDAREPAPIETERLLYLRSGPVARRLMLSFDSLAADIYWMRAIQHYGRERRSERVTNRFELLEPLLDLTTTLDPQFNIAYRFGAIFLAEPPPSGPGRVDQSIALLKKGLENNPGRWQYAFDIGFIYYWYGTGLGRGRMDYEAAAQWFDEAAEVPGAPIWIRQLAAMTRVQGGDTRGARRALQELATSEESWLRGAAERGLEQVSAIETITQLQGEVDAFRATHQRLPAGWAELFPSAPRGSAPVDLRGVPFEYDAATGRVTLSATSPLFPLPRMSGDQ
jgi:tetratricopeptide (TPR) repeat protein